MKILDVKSPVIAAIAVILITSFAADLAFGQKRPDKSKAPKPPARKSIIRSAPPTPATTSGDRFGKTEQQFAAEIARSLEQSIKWEDRTMTGFNVTVAFPRVPVLQTMTSRVEGFGLMSLLMNVAIGDGVTNIAAKVSLPYTVTDETVLRNMYRELLAGFSEGIEAKFQHIRDFQFDSRLGIEIRSIVDDTRFQPIAGKAFVYGRDVYFMLAIPLENDAEDEPPTTESLESRLNDVDRFFNSVKPIALRIPTAAEVDNRFVNQWTDGELKNDHFKFSFSPPSGWQLVSADEIASINRWSRETLSAETGKSFRSSSQQSTIAMFVSGPLGLDHIASISVLWLTATAKFSDAFDVANMTNRIVSNGPGHKVLKRPYETKIGTAMAVRTDKEVTIAGSKQYQYLIFTVNNGQLLSFVVNCYNEEECKAALASLDSYRLIESK